MPSRPTATPIAAPPASSHATSPMMCSGSGPCAPCWLSRVTASTDGGSFRPDSPSSIPERIGGSGSLRSTEKTAAASVGARTAPRSSASRQPRPSSQCVHAATTPMLTTTPTVASAMAAGAAFLRVLPVGGEAALGQDQHERAEAERLGEVRVVEPDADARSRRGPGRARGRREGRAARRCAPAVPPRWPRGPWPPRPARRVRACSLSHCQYHGWPRIASLPGAVSLRGDTRRVMTAAAGAL